MKLTSAAWRRPEFIRVRSNAQELKPWTVHAVSGPRKRKKSSRYDDFEQDWGTENQPPKNLQKVKKESIFSAAEAALKLEPDCNVQLGRRPLGPKNADTVAAERQTSPPDGSPVLPAAADDDVKHSPSLHPVIHCQICKIQCQAPLSDLFCHSWLCGLSDHCKKVDFDAAAIAIK